MYSHYLARAGGAAALLATLLTYSIGTMASDYAAKNGALDGGVMHVGPELLGSPLREPLPPLPEEVGALAEMLWASRTVEDHALALSQRAENRIYVEINQELYPILGYVDTGERLLRTDEVVRSIEEMASRDLRVATPMVGTRSDGRFIEHRGLVSSRQRHLLPPPHDPNDVFYSQFDYRDVRLGSARDTRLLSLVGLAATPAEDLQTRFKAIGSFGAAYDTGVVPTGGFDVPKIALGDDPAAGQTRFTSSEMFDQLPLATILDNQILSLALPGLADQQAQLYLEANNYEDRDELDVKHFYARFWNYEAITVGAGKTYSLFGSQGVVPSSLDQTSKLVGSGTFDETVKNRRQLRLQQSSPDAGGWGWGAAVEDPESGDFTPSMGNTELTRWPSFAANVVYCGANPEDRIQFSSLHRTFGFQAPSGEEFFESAWGLGAFARVLTYVDNFQNGGMFAGAAGGEGIGGYIHGINTAAAFGGGSLQAIKGLGTYGGYHHRWIVRNGWEIATTAAYGYVRFDAPAFLDSGANIELHQGLTNFLVIPSPYLAVGFEYQYGMRETLGGQRGEDNRFLFVLSLNSKPTEKVTTTYRRLSGEATTYADQDVDVYVGESGEAYRQGL